MKKFYQTTFFAFGRQFGKIKAYARDHGLILDAYFVGYSSWNRCVNYYDLFADVDEIKKKADNIIGFLSNQENHDALDRFCKTFSDERFLESKAYIQRLKEFKPGHSSTINEEELIYHILILYHSFPRHPELMADGAINRALPNIDIHQKPWTYATMDLVTNPERALRFNYYPWLHLNLFDEKTESASVFMDQESNRLFWGDTSNNPAEPTTFIKDYFQDSKIQFQYFDPLFLGLIDVDGKPFSGEDYFHFPENQRFADAPCFIAIPLYDDGLSITPAGRVVGNCYFLFKNKEDRAEFMGLDFNPVSANPVKPISTQAVGQDFSRVSANATLLTEALGRIQTNQICDEDLWHKEPLHDFVHKVPLAQDWERILVFDCNENHSELDCWVERSSVVNHAAPEKKDLVRPGTYKDRPVFGSINQKKTPTKTLAALHRQIASAVCGCNNDCAFISHVGEVFYLVRMDRLLSSKVLSDLEPHYVARYINRVLCFQFPRKTVLPVLPGKSRLACAEVLGRRYLDRLLPVFNKLLTKRKVLSHSVTSAVAAIISRNHSHHIGSHVTPRTSLELIRDRLIELNEFPFLLHEIEKKGVTKSGELFNAAFDLVHGMKKKLDEYIQKKADFTAEVATEPIISTKRKQLFNQVLIEFIQNTLLMDNLGTNEGVRYRITNGDDGATSSYNDLKLHFHINGKPTRAFFKVVTLTSPQRVLDQTCYPYSGYVRDVMKNLKPVALHRPAEDVSVAFPGPMGEFALYGFLENLIRNTVKHNVEKIQKTHPSVDIHVEVSQYDPLDVDYVKCEIWDDLTQPTEKLVKTLQDNLERSMVDGEGKLLKGGWGLSEMKIMATLLAGSSDFLDMAGSLKIEKKEKLGRGVLVYEFKLMKAKEVAFITQRHFDKVETWQQQGFSIFSSVAAYINDLGASPAHYQFVVIDILHENLHDNLKEMNQQFPALLPGCPGVTDSHLKEMLHLFPARILVNGTSGIQLPGACVLDKSLVEELFELNDPENSLTWIWDRWLSFLQSRHGHKNPRVSVYWEQGINDDPTKAWAGAFSQLKNQTGIGYSVIGRDHTGKNVFLPPPDLSPEKETHLIYDRHGGGFNLVKKYPLAFHETTEKSSADFTPIFSTLKDDIGIQARCLCEAAFLKILVIDERVSEIAHNLIVGKNPDGSSIQSKKTKIYNSIYHMGMAKGAGVYIATHLNFNNKGPQPLSSRDNGDVNGPVCCVSMHLPENCVIPSDFQVEWQNNGASEACGAFDVVIIHQGVLEKFLKTELENGEKASFIENIAFFVNALKRHVPHVVIDSGRGIPANLPDNVKFLPFSLIEDHLMKETVSKFSLTSVLMSLIRRRQQ